MTEIKTEESKSMVTQAARCQCGNATLSFEHPESDEWSVICRQCSNEGPTCFTKAGAITAWNTRTASQPEREAVLEKALRKAAAWFDDYAEQHDQKMRDAVDSYERAQRADKAIRNAERAKELRAALTTPTPAVSTDEIVAMLERCSEIVDRNLHRQREKVEDVPRMLRQLASRIRGEGDDLTDEQWAKVLDNAPKPNGPLTPITPAVSTDEIERQFREELAKVLDDDGRPKSAEAVGDEDDDIAITSGQAFVAFRAILSRIRESSDA